MAGWFFIILFILAGIGLYIGLTNQETLTIGDTVHTIWTASLIYMFVGVGLAIGAAAAALIAVRQINAAPSIRLEENAIYLPLPHRREMELPYDQIIQWQILKKGKKTGILIESDGREYLIEARLLEKQEYFDEIVTFLRTKARLVEPA
jgi:hypothetical protein